MMPPKTEPMIIPMRGLRLSGFRLSFWFSAEVVEGVGDIVLDGREDETEENATDEDAGSVELDNSNVELGIMLDGVWVWFDSLVTEVLSATLGYISLMLYDNG